MKRFLPLLVACLALAPLQAQYVTDKNEVKVLVPKAPQVKGPVTRLLLVAGREAESVIVLEALRQDLSRQQAFQVVLPPAGSPLAKGLADLDALGREEQGRVAAQLGASHLMLVRLERFAFQNKKTVELLPKMGGDQATDGLRMYKHFWVVKGVLHCPVLDLASGKLTTIAPQNLAKQYYRTSEAIPPPPVGIGEAKEDLTKLAAHKALQMVVPVQVVEALPFLGGGELDKAFASLKAGRLDEALALVRALASAGEASKAQAKARYDLGVLLCLKDQPADGLAALESARQGGCDKEAAERALEVCRAILGAGKP